MKYYLFIALIFQCAGNSWAQTVTFQKTFGGTTSDVSNAGQITADGGYISFGSTSPLNRGYLIKMDTLGNQQWSKDLSNVDVGNFVRQTSDDGYIMTGTTFGPNANIYLLKADSNGNLQWSTAFGGSREENGYSCVQTSDGGYVVVGNSDSFSTPANGDIYLIKTDSAGILEWSRIFGGTGDDRAYSVKQAQDGGFVLSGGTNSFGPPGLYLLKVDNQGNLQWSKTFTTIATGGYGHSVSQTMDGGYAVASSNGNAYLVKTDSAGSLEWSRSFGGNGVDEAYFFEQTLDSGYILAGSTQSFGFGNDDAYLIKADSAGDLEWSKTFGDNDSQTARYVQQTSGGEFIVSGNFGAVNTDVYLIKTDSHGNSGCNETNPATIQSDPGTSEANPPTITVLPATQTYSLLSVASDRLTTTTTICSTQAIVNLEVESPFLIYPNPSKGEFSIISNSGITSSVLRNRRINIYNLFGEMIYSSDKHSNSIIDLSSVQNGVYVVRIEADDVISKNKVIIQK